MNNHSQFSQEDTDIESSAADRSPPARDYLGEKEGGENEDEYTTLSRFISTYRPPEKKYGKPPQKFTRPWYAPWKKVYEGEEGTSSGEPFSYPNTKPSEGTPICIKL